MQDPDLIELFVKPLNALGARYLISGSVAAMLYGEPRAAVEITCVDCHGSIWARANGVTSGFAAMPITNKARCRRKANVQGS